MKTRTGFTVGRGCDPPTGRSKTRPAFLLALAFSFAAAATVRAEVLIERLFMPHDATPSSFAIGLPGGVNFCFDPVRGAVSYAWTGGFLDVTPARPGAGKFIQAAKLSGPIVYQETGVAPLRRGDRSRAPAVEFAGYTLRDDAIEFRYTVDGTLVREEIRVRRGGGGLTRRFQIEAGRDAAWWYVVDGRPPIEVPRDATGALVLDMPFGREAK
jgi:hypothetical protein